MSESVLLSIDDAVATVTLNRPDRLNALDLGVANTLRDVMLTVERDSAVRVVVLAASGRLYCTGHDLNESIDAMEDPPTKLAANRA